MPSQSPAFEVSKPKSKQSKRDKSLHGEKKRKRENGDESLKKSKKHKAERVLVRESPEVGEVNGQLDSEDEVIPETQIVPTSSPPAPEENASQKSKKSMFKKHREIVNEIMDSDGEREKPQLQSKKHKDLLAGLVHSESEAWKSKPKKHRNVEIEAVSEREIRKHKSKKHRDLPDRTATSSPMPIAEIGPKKSKSKLKKHKSLVPIAEEASPFHTQTSSLYLPLAPISQKHALEGICAEHISPLILTYYPPFSGVILSYSHPRLSETPFGDDGSTTLLKNHDEYAVSWAWVTAEFLLLKPEKGVWLEGYVNLQNEGHLGVVCWNLFNASIERKRIPADWKWVGVEDETQGEVEGVSETYAKDGIGYWVNGEGLKMDGMVKFRVSEIETSHDKERGFLSIEGTLLDDEAENILLHQEAEQSISSRKTAGRRLGGMRSKGATSLGVPPAEDLMNVDKPVEQKDY